MPDEVKLYGNILDNISDGVYFLDSRKKITYWNKGAERITGYSASEMVGSFCSDNILVHIDENGTCLCTKNCPVTKTLSDGNVRNVDVYLHHKDGYRIPVSVHVSPIKESDDKVIGAIEIFRDKSNEILDIQFIEDLKKAALLDPLTELANRRNIEMRLHTSFEEMKRHTISFGIIIADIDYFKKVNDTYGHNVGDDILKVVAHTLESNVRASDLVGRWGGEEFFIVFTHITENHLKNLANKLRILVESCFLHVESKIVKVTITMGGTLARPDDTIGSLIERADQLLYRGKVSGRNRVLTAV